MRWHPDERSDSFSILITDRVVVGGLRTLKVSHIKEIHASYLLFEEDDELTHIPLHHVVRVTRDRTGEILWQKRERKTN